MLIPLLILANIAGWWALFDSVRDSGRPPVWLLFGLLGGVIGFAAYYIVDATVMWRNRASRVP